ncbi:MAG: ROK family transcriptional regulator, partial [Pseudomonadota bacterium]
MRGGDSAGLRAYNERLIVSVLLREGPLSKADIARATGLSGQAASVIVNSLVEEGLLLKRDKVRGHVGQPSTPIAPNPEGALSLGVKIGRRSVEAMVVDLVGDVVDEASERHDAPFPDATMARAGRLACGLLDRLPAVASGTGYGRDRLVGAGIAMPDGLEGWAEELRLPPAELAGWAGMDVEGRMAAATGLPVTRYNDATAACAAEMIAGHAITSSSALYIYLGTFVGGGVVLDGRLFPGPQRNAGAIGSMPVATAARRDGRGQLINTASVIDLERLLAEGDVAPGQALAGNAPDAAVIYETWARPAAEALARSIAAALAVIDFEVVVIDGMLPPAWRDDLIARIADARGAFDLTGLAPADLRPGTIGPRARVLG